LALISPDARRFADKAGEGIDAVAIRAVSESQYHWRVRISLPGVEVKHTGSARGRGVFALRPFQANEVVEVCPVVVLRCREDSLPEELRLRVFDWVVLANQPAPAHGLALGYGSLYNHADHANLRYQAQILFPSHNLLFIAVRLIVAGEELTINYNAVGGGPEWPDNNWFERHKIKKVE
jgi:uncharacterized protein